MAKPGAAPVKSHPFRNPGLHEKKARAGLLLLGSSSAWLNRYTRIGLSGRYGSAQGCNRSANSVAGTRHRVDSKPCRIAQGAQGLHRALVRAHFPDRQSRHCRRFTGRHCACRTTAQWRSGDCFPAQVSSPFKTALPAPKPTMARKTPGTANSPWRQGYKNLKPKAFSKTSAPEFHQSQIASLTGKPSARFLIDLEGLRRLLPEPNPSSRPCIAKTNTAFLSFPLKTGHFYLALTVRTASCR